MASPSPLPANVRSSTTLGFGAGPSPDSGSFNPWIVVGMVGFLLVVALTVMVLCIWREERRRKAPVCRIKRVKFSEGDAVESQEKDDHCSICLVEYEDDSDKLGVLPCGHRYHTACIEQWMGLSIDHTCPICRAMV